MAAARRKGTHSPAEWDALVRVCGDRCVMCGATDQRLERDHIVPVYAAGCDCIANIQPVCARCNCSKGPDDRDLRPVGWSEALVAALEGVE